MEDWLPSKHNLKSFPGQEAPDIEITVELSAIADRTLRLWFVVAGQTDLIAKPGPAQPKRGTGLWQHTCFEIFVRAEDQRSYCEVNLSPSGEWAAYLFDDHRFGMQDLYIEEPAISVAEMGRFWSVGADVTLPHLPITTKWRVNLAAVIEETSGRKSYWALAHPSDAPDFHHPDCFKLELPASTRP